MSKTHNLDYYSSLYQKYLDFNTVSEERAHVNHYFYPQFFIASRCSQFLNSCVSSKALKGAYVSAGSAAIAVSGVFSRSLSKRVETWLFDPVDTKTVLAVGRPLQALFKPLAARTATTIPVLGWVDRSLISLCRHIYIVTKDLNTILSVPERLHSLLDQIIEEEAQIAENKPTTLAGRVWVWTKEAIGIIKDSFINLIQRIFRYISTSLKKVSLLEPSVAWIEEVCAQVKPYLSELFNRSKEKLIKHAHHVIEKNETAVRQKAMGIVAETVARKAFSFFVTFTITTAISYALYRAPDLIPGVTSFEHAEKLLQIRKVIGISHWILSVAPIFYGLHEEYKENFNPEASTFKELRHLINFNNLRKLIKFIKAINSKPSNN